MQTYALLISALGGAVAALVLRSSLRIIGILCTRWIPIAVYDCAAPEPSRKLELRHTWGCQVADSKSSSGNAWEYRPIRIERPGEQITGEHTIYGPYVNDFGMPGFYRVRFRIRGDGLPRKDERSKDEDERIIVLDVVQSRFGTDAVLRLLGQKVVRAREIRNCYRYFDIECYAAGTGVYEYRCAVLNEAKALKGGKIHFDNIKVYSNPPIWEAL